MSVSSCVSLVSSGSSVESYCWLSSCCLRYPRRDGSAIVVGAVSDCVGFRALFVGRGLDGGIVYVRRRVENVSRPGDGIVVLEMKEKVPEKTTYPSRWAPDMLSSYGISWD